jgi:nucleoid DNA-binding protein
MPVRIGNFGTFSAHSVAAKKARNPQNGEPIDVPAKEKIRFKPFTAFKEAVQSKENHAA